MKMITIVVLLLALSAWQHHFIIEGVVSHLEMNLTIIGTFVFSIVISFIFISKLKNEIVAFKALREMWDDIQINQAGHVTDPFRCHYRCAQPAQIFHRPRLLGHAYELVTGELARTKKIRVSIETMNTLVHTIDEAIQDEKSLIIYLSGLLVFMGLIGTFVGLLHMVSSIGGIIGSLANSAGGSEATGAFAQLLGALQEPLKGMASGFASSLFGLFSSLVVGLLGRFAGQAANVLKGEFEAWLAGVVQIGEDQQANQRGDAQASPVASSGHGDPALVRMVGNVLSDYGRVAGTFDQVSRLLQEMSQRQDKQAEHYRGLHADVGQIKDHQARMMEGMASLTQIVPTLAALGGRLETVGASVAQRIEADSTELRASLAEFSRTQANGLRVLSSSQLQTATQMSAAMDQLSADLERRSVMPAPTTGLDVVLERSLSTGLAQMGRVLDEKASRIDVHANRLAESQAVMMGTLNQLAEHQLAALPAEDVARRMEAAVSEGLSQASQTMETAFTAYSGLLHLALTAVERSTRPDDGQSLSNEPGHALSPAEIQARMEREGKDIAGMVDEFRKRTGDGRLV